MQGLSAPEHGGGSAGTDLEGGRGTPQSLEAAAGALRASWGLLPPQISAAVKQQKEPRWGIPAGLTGAGPAGFG